MRDKSFNAHMVFSSSLSKMFSFFPLQASATAADLLTLRKLLFEAPLSGTAGPSAGLGLNPNRVLSILSLSI